MATCNMWYICSCIYNLVKHKHELWELSPRGVAWWQRAWDLHSRSWVRVRAYISCKSLEQPGFYLLTWAHKVRFPGSRVFSNSKKKKKSCEKGRHAMMNSKHEGWLNLSKYKTSDPIKASSTFELRISPCLFLCYYLGLICFYIKKKKT